MAAQRPWQSRVDTLVEHISGDDVDYADRKLHRDVYSYVKDKIVGGAPQTACPPLPVVVYAIRNILEPAFVARLVPALLELLVHLEVVRANVVEQIRKILRLDAEARSSKNPHAPLLSEDERDALEALVRPSRLLAQRTIYRKVIHGCCMLHIHHLWRTFDAREDRPLTDYLIEYFPAFFTRDPDLLEDCARALRDCPWHYKLADDELDENRAVGAQAARFVSAAGRYTEDPQAYCEQNGYDPDASFDDLFPPPDPASISAAIMHFVEKVQLAHDGLQSMLDDHEE